MTTLGGQYSVKAAAAFTRAKHANVKDAPVPVTYAPSITGRRMVAALEPQRISPDVAIAPKSRVLRGPADVALGSQHLNDDMMRRGNGSPGACLLAHGHSDVSRCLAVVETTALSGHDDLPGALLKLHEGSRRPPRSRVVGFNCFRPILHCCRNM